MCSLGRLKPGDSATVLVAGRARATGTSRNRATVLSLPIDTSIARQHGDRPRADRSERGRGCRGGRRTTDVHGLMRRAVAALATLLSGLAVVGSAHAAIEAQWAYLLRDVGALERPRPDAHRRARLDVDARG